MSAPRDARGIVALWQAWTQTKGPSAMQTETARSEELERAGAVGGSRRNVYHNTNQQVQSIPIATRHLLNSSKWQSKGAGVTIWKLKVHRGHRRRQRPVGGPRPDWQLADCVRTGLLYQLMAICLHPWQR